MLHVRCNFVAKQRILPKVRDETITCTIRKRVVLIYFCFSYKKIRELKLLVFLSFKEKDKRIKTYLDKKSKSYWNPSEFQLI